MGNNIKWYKLHSLGLIVIIIVMILVGLLIPYDYRIWAWICTLILLTLFTIISGHGVTGLWKGLLIDERKKVSLSRLQMVLWTIIILSSFLTAALSNIATKQVNPLSISIPNELWILMGISTTSLVSSPLIKTRKKIKEAIKENPSVEDAQMADMFKGEEKVNFTLLDLGKVQMFFFTIVLALAYSVAIGTIFLETSVRIYKFPDLDPAMITLLGISHAGYLTNKAISRSEPE